MIFVVVLHCARQLFGCLLDIGAVAVAVSVDVYIVVVLCVCCAISYEEHNTQYNKPFMLNKGGRVEKRALECLEQAEQKLKKRNG